MVRYTACLMQFEWKLIQHLRKRTKKKSFSIQTREYTHKSVSYILIALLMQQMNIHTGSPVFWQETIKRESKMKLNKTNN